ncbi:unnamed protein product [Durusdinium trenchii]|uniref:Uncharacterized protein n=1 Tax=Durusdinium trenchii TaxID=1381693 RepID=A0ABP0SQC8_9DINO
MADPLPPLLTYCEGGDLEAAKAELQATTAGCTVPVDDRRAPKPFAGDVKKLLKLRDPDRRQLGDGRSGELAVFLIAQGANVNVEDHLEDEESWTPLHSCASRGAGALVAKLLEASADAEAQTSSGGAALHFAASKGHEEAGRWKWSIPYLYGTTSPCISIFATVDETRPVPCEVLKQLVAAGYTGISLRTLRREELLFCAQRALGSLLEAQADVLCRDRAGENVFHIAINGQHLEMCELLFERDEAERLMIQENEDGKTAAQQLEEPASSGGWTKYFGLVWFVRNSIDDRRGVVNSIDDEKALDPPEAFDVRSGPGLAMARRPGLMKRSSLDLSPLYKAVAVAVGAFLHLVAPPCIFLCVRRPGERQWPQQRQRRLVDHARNGVRTEVTALLSFHVHFQLGLGTWLLALVSLWPYQLARKSEARALEFRLDRTWPRLSLGLGVWIEGGHFRDREFWKVLGRSQLLHGRPVRGSSLLWPAFSIFSADNQVSMTSFLEPYLALGFVQSWTAAVPGNLLPFRGPAASAAISFNRRALRHTGATELPQPTSRTPDPPTSRPSGWDSKRSGRYVRRSVRVQLEEMDLPTWTIRSRVMGDGARSMAEHGGAWRSRSTGTMRKSYSSGTLQKTGQATITSPMAADHEMPKLPKYLNVTNLTKFRKLPSSTGNLHGWLAEDYSQINWPLPKMFGKEKYGYSMIDIDDPRYIKECAQMSQKLIRLHYDQQIIDYTWRNTYKGLLTAEHRLATLPHNKCPQKTEDMMKKEVDSCMKQLLELQQQKDMYEQQIKEIYERCDSIKATIKKENDLEDLRKTMEKQTKEKISIDSPFWKAKFNIRSVNAPPRSGSLSFD